MSRMLLPFIFLFLFAFLDGQGQTIRRVNKDTDVSGLNVYHSAQAAHDAAASNDILVIEPSDTDYGILTVSKPLKIYGNGYFLDVNSDLRAEEKSSRFSGINFNTGSQGSEIYGIEVMGGEEAELNVYGVSNIRIERCRIYEIELYTEDMDGAAHNNVSNIVIHANIVNGVDATNEFSFDDYGYGIYHVEVSNNIFTPINGDGGFLDCTGSQSWLITHNMFANSGFYVANSVFENNILYNSTETSFDSNSIVTFNVSSGNNLLTGNGNQNNIDLSTSFTGTGSDDMKWIVDGGSVLKTAGRNGVEVGPFGGNNPYVVSGLPAMPFILDLRIPTNSGSDDSPLHTVISAASHN